MSGDFYKECYDGVAQQKMSPEDFTNSFCRVCRNQNCKRSGQGRTSWLRRVLTQQERLIDNPKFADPNDPKYADIRDQDFKDMLREALRLEIADQKGDWEPVTAQDVESYILGGGGVSTKVEPPPPPPPVEEEDEVDPNEPIIEWEVRIPGSKGGTYQVTLGGMPGQPPTWRCVCKNFQYGGGDPCPHIKKASAVYAKSRQMKLESKPPEPSHFQAPPVPRQEAKPVAPEPVEIARDPTPARSEILQGEPRIRNPGPRPTAGNTRVPSEGLMIGGGPAPEVPVQPVHDPWSVPKKTEVVQVGARIRMGMGKPPEDSKK